MSQLPSRSRQRDFISTPDLPALPWSFYYKTDYIYSRMDHNSNIHFLWVGKTSNCCGYGEQCPFCTFFRFFWDLAIGSGQHSTELLDSQEGRYCWLLIILIIDITERREADCVLCCPDSPCYCLQWTKLLLRWTPDRQNRQRCGRKKDPNWPGLCPQDCPGGGKRAHIDK